MSDWRESYQAAILETNDSKLKSLIEEAEAAISTRLAQVNGAPDRAIEVEEIWKAAGKLSLLRVERLGEKPGRLPQQPASEM
jgi:hypothetical protein